jgi:hypothetical protein
MEDYQTIFGAVLTASREKPLKWFHAIGLARYHLAEAKCQ